MLLTALGHIQAISNVKSNVARDYFSSYRCFRKILSAAVNSTSCEDASGEWRSRTFAIAWYVCVHVPDLVAFLGFSFLFCCCRKYNGAQIIVACLLPVDLETPMSWMCRGSAFSRRNLDITISGSRRREGNKKALSWRYFACLVKNDHLRAIV